MSVFGLLTFLNPMILSALALLPALWFLLRATPPQPTKLAFPAFNLLLGLKDKKQTPSRTPLLLLLLRLLISALIILGLSGPILNAPETDKLDDRNILVVVDDSWTAAPNWSLRRNVLLAIAEEARLRDRLVYLVTTTEAPGSRSLESQVVEPKALSVEEFSAAISSLEPKSLLPNHQRAAEAIEQLQARSPNLDVRWLTDGIDHNGIDLLKDKLRQFGGGTTYRSDDEIVVIKGRAKSEASEEFSIARTGASDWSGTLVVTARDGRELGRAPIEFQSGDLQTTASVRLPIALRNQIGTARIEGVASAGAVYLADGRSQRLLVGLVGESRSTGDLLDGVSYIRAALRPYADFFSASLPDVIAANPNMIVLDDIGTLREEDA
ncbi:MAG: BatA domain-containing protein, partial [Pseudomonadota bacterium]